VNFAYTHRMEQYDELDTFEKVESWPTIEEIERRLRMLGCTKEQVRRHLDQVAMSRVEAAREKPNSRSKRR
jgi:hypothetical protein